MRIDDVDGLIEELCDSYVEVGEVRMVLNATRHSTIRAIVPKYVVQDDPLAAIAMLREWIAGQTGCGIHPEIKDCLDKIEETVKILHGDEQQEREAEDGTD
jgi:hypothetical protein